ncbi:MAG: PrsW family intramembrane metalloprotease [Oscillospiraceae bacterium]|nr:PrsW family intramembrane metalloprotease [Oscillospiraceae bacterium]
MLFVLPSLAILAIYFLAAVVPAVFLMRYIYEKDTVEKEPPMLLLALVFSGVCAALASIVLESLGVSVLNSLVDANSPAYTVILAFLVVAVVEEGTKFILLKLRTWRDPNFNYRFDGVIYAVFVSLGFAAFENIKYVFGYGLSVAFPRALLAIPGHMGFAVFMGIFYGRAKLCESRGDKAGKIANLAAGYIIAVLLHGFYDSCAMLGTTLATGMFIAFVVLMYVVVLRLIKREAQTDTPIDTGLRYF